MSEVLLDNRPVRGDSVNLLTPQMVQERLKLSRPAVYRLLSRGTAGRPPLPHFKIGKSVRVSEDKLAQWLEMDTTHTTST